MISVIIPIYNIEKYIARCLESIIAQTYTELEIICIDDGSTDNSAQICKKYMKKDDRINYVYISNGGVSNARNYALKLINGEWFAFVDGDDWLEPNFFEVLLSNAIKYKCDVSACQYQISTEYKTGYEGSVENTHLFGNSKECIHSFICSKNSLQGQIWNKIYLTDKFRHFEFDKSVRVNEDCLYTYEIMEHCDSACVCDAQLYHWYVRENSACHKKHKTINFDSANVFLYLLNKIEDNQDIDVSNELKKNYVCDVLKILFDTKKERKREDIIQALDKIKMWKKNVWNNISIKTKIKYYLVIIKYMV